MEFNTFNLGIVRMRIKPKILLIMKLVIIMIFTCLMQVSASSLAQRITLSEKNVSLELLLKKIKQQTGYDVLYGDKVLNNDKKISVKLYNAPIVDALDMILEDQNLSYTVGDKTIVIKEKSPTFLERLADRWAAIDITGTVVDDKGYPLPGATVKAKGAKAVITDIRGRFMLEHVEEGAIVMISYTGYVTLEMPAKQSMGTIALKLSDNPLDQVQIIAYGTQTKRYSLGNVVSVKAEDIEKQPVQNPLLALQGRVAGLEITQINGLPGSGVRVRIQGQNSIRNGTDPLYVIDGTPYASQTLKTTRVGQDLLGTSRNTADPINPDASPGGGGNPFNYINPSDIESIEVLKDADATAIYGSRAANGAILITTKKGKAGETQLDFNLQQGWGHVRKFMELLNTQQYLEMRREAFKNDGLPLPSLQTDPNNTDYDLNGHWDINAETDWQKELIGGTAKYTNAILTISGGSTSTNFRLSGTYNRMTTVFPGESGNPSANLHFAINNTSANQKFTIQFSGLFMSNVNRLPSGDLTSDAITRSPNAPSIYNADGSLNWAPTAAGSSTTINPLAYTVSKFKMKVSNMVSSLTLGYKILTGLEIKANMGYTNQQINEFSGRPLTRRPPEERISADPNSLREAYYSNSNINSWNVEPQLTYNRLFGLHQFNVLIGGTVHQNYGEGLAMTGYGYVNDASLESPKAAASIGVNNTLIPIYKYVGAFARLNYSLKARYLVNLTLRRDGSTRFGPGSRFHNFGSVAAGWIFTEEKLIKEKLPFLSFGKLRASYGTSGNDQIEDYLYLSLVDVSGTPAYQGTVGYSVSRLANAYLEWEEKKSLQMGIDLGFVKDRILLTANYVRNRTSNQLLPYDLPRIAGQTGIIANFPATLENSGVELNMQTVNLKSTAFEWRTSINLSLIRNKLIEFPNLENSVYARFLAVGKPFNILKRYQYIGLDPATGLHQFVGKNGPVSTEADASPNEAMIDPNPRYYGGLQNSVRYKNFSFSLSLSFAKKIVGRYVNNAYPGQFEAGRGNQPVEVLNRWQQPGDVAEYSKFSQGTLLRENGQLWAQNSDQSYVDASFISLKNVSLSYQLPLQWVQKIALKSATIYTNTQNVFTWTKYKGFDPESPGIGLPPLRIITLGIQASL